MDYTYLIDLFLNLDKHLEVITASWGVWIYVLLFAIIFIETGLVIFPLLPGDSLLFTAGLLCAQPGGLNIWILIPLLTFAAILGDNINYFVGKFFSAHVLSWKIAGKVLVKKEWLDKTHAFFEKNGTKTIILARFVPIVRTITPFVSGLGRMNYKVFLPYDILGGIIWVGGVSLLGYFLGQIPFVEKNLEKFILGIVFLSILPIIIEFIRNRVAKYNT